MSEKPAWHGTKQEATELADVLRKNCGCENFSLGGNMETCGAHQIMFDDQRAQNGLLFARSIVDRLTDEEFCRSKK